MSSFLALVTNIWPLIFSKMNKVQKEFIWILKNLKLCGKYKNEGLKIMQTWLLLFVSLVCFLGLFDFCFNFDRSLCINVIHLHITILQTTRKMCGKWSVKNVIRKIFIIYVWLKLDQRSRVCNPKPRSCS